MKKLLLIFLLCLTHSAWAEWVLVYENEEARFYVDGVMAGRVTGSMPTGTAVGERAIVIKSAGTTERVARLTGLTFSTIY